MGAGASTNAEIKVGDSDAVIVEVIGGKIVARGSTKPIEEVGMVLLVIDPRKLEEYTFSECVELLTPEVKAKVKPFLLLPSTTSSPACLALLEVALLSLSVANVAVADGVAAKDVVSLVRLDDYLAYGDQILLAMASSGKRVYPAEETSSMLGFLEELEELAGMVPDYKFKGEGDAPLVSTGPRSRFFESIFNCRVFINHVACEGLEENDIKGMVIDTVVPILKEASFGLPALEGCPVATATAPPSAPLCPSKKGPPMFVAFSEAAAAKYTASVGVPVAAVTSLTVKEGFDDENKAEFFQVNGVPYKEFFTGPVVLLVDAPVDLACSVEASKVAGHWGGYANLVIILLNRLREAGSDLGFFTSTVVLFAADYAAHTKNASMLMTMPNLVANADVVLFASDAEAPKVGIFFAKAQFAEENTAMILAKQSVPYPSNHFFTFDSCMGETIADGSLAVPALTVGPALIGLDAAKFNQKNSPCTRFLLSGADKQPLGERLVFGADGNLGATVVVPSAVLWHLFEGIMYCEDIIDSEEIEEAQSNFHDMGFGSLSIYFGDDAKSIKKEFKPPAKWQKRYEELNGSNA